MTIKQPGVFRLSAHSASFRAGWVDCWSVPNFLLIIDYTWHPIYPQKADEQLKQSCKRAAPTLGYTGQLSPFNVVHHVDRTF